MIGSGKLSILKHTSTIMIIMSFIVRASGNILKSIAEHSSLFAQNSKKSFIALVKGENPEACIIKHFTAIIYGFP